MKKIFIIIMIISGSLIAETLDFEQAVNIALENNLSIKIAKNGLQITKNLVNPGVLLPSVSINGNSSYTNTNANIGADTERHLNSTSISTNYTLFSGFYVLNSYKKLKMQYNLSELEIRYQVESIISALAQTYYSLANAEEQLDLAKESLRISGDRLRRVIEKEKLGRVNKIERLSAEVDYNRDSISVENMKLNYENFMRNLNVILNRNVEDKYEIEKNVEMLTLPGYDELKTNAFDKNADFQATKYGIDLAEMDIKLAKSRYMPSLNMSGSYGMNKTNFAFDPGIGDPDKSWSVGLSLNFSLFDGFQRKIQKQNAKILLNNQKLTLEQSRLNLEKELASSFTTYINSKKTLSMEKMNLEANQFNFDRTKELYELGQLTSVQFREAQLNLMRVKNNISSGKYSVKLNEINLMKLAGILLD